MISKTTQLIVFQLNYLHYFTKKKNSQCKNFAIKAAYFLSRLLTLFSDNANFIFRRFSFLNLEIIFFLIELLISYR